MSYRWLIRLAHTFDIACSISLPELRTFGGESPAIFELQSQVAGSRLVCGVLPYSLVCMSVKFFAILSLEISSRALSA